MESSKLKHLPFRNFDEAALEVLSQLQKRLGFSLWMMTRTEGDDWIVLQAKDSGYGVQAGDVFRWTDSFCSRMVQGKGPCIAPQSVDVPAYLEAPIGRDIAIGAYIGMPVIRANGELFGTLCAIDPSPQPAEIINEKETIELFARLLETILEYDLRSTEQARLVERRTEEALRDELTGLINRRGWNQFLHNEELRSQRFGSPVCVFIIDLDGLKAVNDSAGHEAGDRLIRKASDVLTNGVRSVDLVARLGGDEFGILAVETDGSGGQELYEKLQRFLESAGVKASVGWAMRSPSEGLQEAVAAADKAMYRSKRKRKESLK